MDAEKKQEPEKKPVAIAKPIREEYLVMEKAKEVKDTLATVEVSLATYKELEYLLTEIGYGDAIEGDIIDMTNVRVAKGEVFIIETTDGLIDALEKDSGTLVDVKPPEQKAQKIDPIVVLLNGKTTEFYSRDGMITYEEIYHHVYIDLLVDYPKGTLLPKTPSCTWRTVEGKSGILLPKQMAPLVSGMIINMVDTSNA